MLRLQNSAVRMNFSPSEIMKKKKESHARFAVTLHTAKVTAVAHDELVNVNNT